MRPLLRFVGRNLARRELQLSQLYLDAQRCQVQLHQQCLHSRSAENRIRTKTGGLAQPFVVSTLAVAPSLSRLVRQAGDFDLLEGEEEQQNTSPCPCNE